MKKLIAIPLENGIMSAHFGHCEKFAIIETENNRIVKIFEATTPAHEPGANPRWLINQGVTDLIVAGIGQKAISNLSQHNIIILSGDAGKTIENLVDDVLNNKLKEFDSACISHQHHGHGHCHCGNN